ncbi:hypothetical protein M422DRAFT_261032 [Sphaerobolus stellatus SS14]|uniref:Uncharacterized protein n=1 Tax=Sphaerobolus stellatus (strain SS14) TaxID=990650 RepID=A0A0C9VH52_SPHS4|nr:hypothetical protein M422DRAFT_261032 [Sphaerobolus stellatus SS14]
MERDGEKWPYSAAGSECTAYMQIRQCAPAPNKGKKPLTALPYDEAPPSGALDVEMNAPVMTGVRSTLQDESAMNLDNELDNIYD